MLSQSLCGGMAHELRCSPGAEAVRGDISSSQAVKADFYQYCATISADRRANPRDDLATVIATSQVDGRAISEFEAMSYYVIVATAGHDTTSSTTAGAMWALCENPDQFAYVKGDLSRVPGFIDDAVRWATPVKTFMRSATANTQVGGQAIAKDDWLMLCYASGNRDETVFDEPDRFRAYRNPNKQLAVACGRQ